LFGLFGSTSAERKEARAEKYAAKVGGDVVKGENGRVSVNVVKSAADGGISITSKTNFGDFSTLKSNVKSWTKNNKKELLNFTEGTEKVGSAVAITGSIAAVAGTPIGGVGGIPGAVVATVGGGVNLVGSGMTATVLYLAGDTEKSKTKAIETVISLGVSKTAEVGTTTLMKGLPSEEVEAVQNVFEGAKTASESLGTKSE
jgi:hypothetical protein